MIALDDVTSAVVRTLFGALRDELWSVGAIWLVTCAPADVDEILRPPVDVFFETTIALTPLPDDAPER